METTGQLTGICPAGVLAFRRRWGAPEMQKHWVVDLILAERSQREALTRGTNAPARRSHARVLLLAAEGLTDEEIAAATGKTAITGVAP